MLKRKQQPIETGITSRQEEEENPASRQKDEGRKPVSRQKEKKTSSRPARSRTLEAWGWASSAARFRGVLVICLVLVVLFQGLLNIRLSMHETIYIGVSSDGQRIMLDKVSSGINYEMFCRTFANYMFTYSPKIVEKNTSLALGLMSRPLQQAYSIKMGSSFVKSVIANSIVQNLVVNQVKIIEQTEEGFKAQLKVTRVRSDGSTGKTSDKDLMITLTIERTSRLSRVNPWGLVVTSIAENEVYQ